jgi:hypothetical protein
MKDCEFFVFLLGLFNEALSAIAYIDSVKRIL